MNWRDFNIASIPISSAHCDFAWSTRKAPTTTKKHWTFFLGKIFFPKKKQTEKCVGIRNNMKIYNLQQVSGKNLPQ
jgi:hypothetical protein